MAQRYDHVRFIAVAARMADGDIDPKNLPILLIYQGGQLIQSMLELEKSLEGPVSYDGLEWLLSDILK